MLYNDAVKRVLDIFPDALFDENEHGEITIATGMKFHPMNIAELVYVDDMEDEGCVTCNYSECQCDIMYDNYKDSLLERD